MILAPWGMGPLVRAGIQKLGRREGPFSGSPERRFPPQRHLHGRACRGAGLATAASNLLGPHGHLPRRPCDFTAKVRRSVEPRGTLAGGQVSLWLGPTFAVGASAGPSSQLRVPGLGLTSMSCWEGAWPVGPGPQGMTSGLGASILKDAAIWSLPK